MGRVWSEAHKYELWCAVERIVLEAHAAAGTVPADAVEPVRSAPAPTPEAVAAVEAVTQHDVIAFLTRGAAKTRPGGRRGGGPSARPPSAPSAPGLAPHPP